MSIYSTFRILSYFQLHRVTWWTRNDTEEPELTSDEDNDTDDDKNDENYELESLQDETKKRNSDDVSKTKFFGSV